VSSLREQLASNQADLAASRQKEQEVSLQLSAFTAERLQEQSTHVALVAALQEQVSSLLASQDQWRTEKLEIEDEMHQLQKDLASAEVERDAAEVTSVRAVCPKSCLPLNAAALLFGMTVICSCRCPAKALKYMWMACGTYCHKCIAAPQVCANLSVYMFRMTSCCVFSEGGEAPLSSMLESERLLSLKDQITAEIIEKNLRIQQLEESYTLLSTEV
jgi:hypothetical protein